MLDPCTSSQLCYLYLLASLTELQNILLVSIWHSNTLQAVFAFWRRFHISSLYSGIFQEHNYLCQMWQKKIMSFSEYLGFSLCGQLSWKKQPPLWSRNPSQMDVILGLVIKSWSLGSGWLVPVRGELWSLLFLSPVLASWSYDPLRISKILTLFL